MDQVDNKYTRAMKFNIQKEVTIYTDGACSGNPGPGGWGAILIYKGNKKELSGYYQEATNNRMELVAALKALQALKKLAKLNFTQIVHIYVMLLIMHGLWFGSVMDGSILKKNLLKIKIYGSS